MHPDLEAIRCTIMRGGTSKGIYIHKNCLPADQTVRDKVIQAIFGSPDVRQIDGLGGADALTSKLAIVGPTTHPDADVEYTFAQVGIEQDIVDYGGNCGNISAGVGPFAIDSGMVPAREPMTTVRIWQTNTEKMLVTEVPVKDGMACTDGDFSIDGVPGTGAKIIMDFSDTVGSTTGKLLPTGNVVDNLKTVAGEYPVTIVDAGIPVVFISADSLGLLGTESAREIDADADLLKRIKAIRGTAATVIGMANSPEHALTDTPYSPFIAIVSRPASYTTPVGKKIAENDIDLVSRLLFMQKMHKTYPGTGSVATAAAARIKGSLVENVLASAAHTSDRIRIGHPSGVMVVESVAAAGGGEQPAFSKRAFYRTARRIMDGCVYVKKSVFQKKP